MEQVNLLALFIAQFEEWWFQVKDFGVRILLNNLDWIKFGFLIVSIALLIGIIVLTKKGLEDFEDFRGLTLRDILGFNSKKKEESE